MNGFITKTPNQKSLDPTKRVKYTLGMVLGPDEFEQNLTYLMERDRLHNRLLHGYGTVCGLKVRQQMDDDDPTIPADPPQVMVQPGMAVNPQGQFIRIPQPQCASLNKWLDNHEDEVVAYFGSPVEPDHLTLYVVLGFAECETDATFVPGGPCRTQEETIVPSRISDAFDLKLVFEPPAQVEELVVDRFGELLCRIEITADAGDHTTQEELEALVRGLATGDVAADLASPEETVPPLYLHPHTATEVLEHVFRVWVTEVRPQLLACAKNCSGGPPDEDYVLLAEISFGLNVTPNGRFLVGSPITVNEVARPILLHTRLLQEQLLCGSAYQQAGQHTFATLSWHNDNTIRAWIHYHPLLDIPVSAISVTGSEIPVLGVTRQGDTNVFDLELSDSPPLNFLDKQLTVTFDAAQITETADPARTLLASLDEINMDFIDRRENILFSFLTEDHYTLNRLTNVDAQPMADGDVLAWNEADDQWTAQAITGGGGVTTHGDLDSLTNDDHPQYLLVNQADRALSSDLNAGTHRITNLSQGSGINDAVTFSQALKDGDTAGGDLAGSYPNPTVAKLRGHSISTNSPQTHQVLTWNGSEWMPDESGWERNLTRIVALSWNHGQTSNLQVTIDGERLLGLAIAFGKANTSDLGLVNKYTVDSHSFQVFMEQPDNTARFTSILLLNPLRIHKLRTVVIDRTTGLIISGESTLLTERTARGAFFEFAQEQIELLPRQPYLSVLVRGDFIMDETNQRAIDAEFVRGHLPTGDRPSGSALAIQGGRFESWLTYQGGREIDVNRAGVEELVDIPGIGEELADRIVTLRDSRGGFASLEDLVDVRGIGPALLEQIREYLTIS